MRLVFIFAFASATLIGACAAYVFPEKAAVLLQKEGSATVMPNLLPFYKELNEMYEAEKKEYTNAKGEWKKEDMKLWWSPSFFTFNPATFKKRRLSRPMGGGLKMSDFQAYKFHYQPNFESLEKTVPALVLKFSRMGFEFKIVSSSLMLETFKDPPLLGAETNNNMFGKYFTFYGIRSTTEVYKLVQAWKEVMEKLQLFGPDKPSGGITPPFDCLLGTVRPPEGMEGAAIVTKGFSYRYAHEYGGNYMANHGELLVVNEANNEAYYTVNGRKITRTVPPFGPGITPYDWVTTPELRPFTNDDMRQLLGRNCACAPDWVTWPPPVGGLKLQDRDCPDPKAARIPGYSFTATKSPAPLSRLTVPADDGADIAKRLREKLGKNVEGEHVASSIAAAIISVIEEEESDDEERIGGPGDPWA